MATRWNAPFRIALIYVTRLNYAIGHRFNPSMDK